MAMMAWRSMLGFPSVSLLGGTSVFTRLNGAAEIGEEMEQHLAAEDQQARQRQPHAARRHEQPAAIVVGVHPERREQVERYRPRHHGKPEQGAENRQRPEPHRQSDKQQRARG